MSPFKLLDIFSGIGGFSLGLERSGYFDTVAFCEIEPYCRAVLKRHWPEVPCYEDIRTLSANTLRRDGVAVDAICGGFPCQDVSLAGKGLGLEGERSGLWRDYARLIGELRPRVAIVENTPGLLGRGFGRVLGDLSRLGYDAIWDVIPASALGARHKRERIWLVAYPSQTRRRQRGRFEFTEDSNTERDICEWLNQPEPVRVAHGVPNRMVRVEALGNAVVPQVVQVVGEAVGQAFDFERRAA